jgi:hypothetical protein
MLGRRDLQKHVNLGVQKHHRKEQNVSLSSTNQLYAICCHGINVILSTSLLLVALFLTGHTVIAVIEMCTILLEVLQ